MLLLKMLLSRLTRKITQATVNALLLVGVAAQGASIGGIVESTGVGSLERETSDTVVATVGE